MEVTLIQIEDIKEKAETLEKALNACKKPELALIIHHFSHEGLLELLDMISCALTCQYNKQQSEVKH